VNNSFRRGIFEGKTMKPGWFGPKRIGWGVAPRSWQGWAVALLLLAALAAAMRWLRPAIQESTGLSMPVATGCIVVAYLAIMAGVIALTYDGGTS
jgi:hypothetical protein